MGVIACGGLDCHGAALGLGPPRENLNDVSFELGTASAPAGTLLSALEPECVPHPIGPVSPRGLTGWHLRRSF
jgi:hypothetical protein